MSTKNHTIRILANHPETQDATEYEREESEARIDHLIPTGERILFLEVTVRDALEFTDRLIVRGVDVDGHHVLRAEGTAIPNSIALCCCISAP